MDRTQVVEKVKEQSVWWVNQRLHKLREALLESMSLNPFLAPALYEIHDANNFAELGDLLIAGHLMVGHATGFGKLIDEKILPNVFGTHKLDAKFRAVTPPLNESCFDEIDHILVKPGKKPALLSLKAGRWTIQLTMAVQLNKAFNEILEKHGGKFDEIVVGVFYGKQETLTDKYDILRGINRGKNHDVVDLTENVKVLSGRDFWAWINDGELNTQEWVLDGIIAGLNEAISRTELSEIHANFTKTFNDNYAKYTRANGEIDWHSLLKDING